MIELRTVSQKFGQTPVSGGANQFEVVLSVSIVKYTSKLLKNASETTGELEMVSVW